MLAPTVMGVPVTLLPDRDNPAGRVLPDVTLHATDPIEDDAESDTVAELPRITSEAVPDAVRPDVMLALMYWYAV